MKIEQFEQSYLEKFWRRQRYQWENYVEGAHHDLTALDTEILELVQSRKDAVECSGRKAQVLRSIMYRDLVDKHPGVAQLRNRLDEWSNYSPRMSLEEKRDGTRSRLLVARSMKPDVLELMRRRDRRARDLGFSSYVDLVLSTEGLERETLTGFLAHYLERDLAAAKDVITKYQISWGNWFRDLRAIGRLDHGLNATLVMEEFLQKIGFAQLNDRIHVVSKQQGVSGYVGILSVPDDIRIVVRPIESLKGLLTLFHELGHAVAHALNKAVGLFKTCSAAYDESMGVVMEHVAAITFLDGENREYAREIFLLENARCAISSLFELALWENPEEAEELYCEYYGRLGVEICEPLLWVLDSFRTIDPVYIHNYVIGAVVANRTVSFLKDLNPTDHEAWGKWLEENYFADGRQRTLKEKVKVIGDLI